MSFGTAYATKKRGMKIPHVEIKPHPPEIAELSKEQIEHARKRFAEKPSGKTVEDVPAEGYASGYPVGNKMAKGGEASEHEQDADMIARIMHKRKMYSRGGEVANDVGVAEADELPAEFDDLVLRDDLDGAQPVDSNEEGDSDVSDDPIDRIMLKRKKDKLPRPA